MSGELVVPPAAVKDANAVEMLRVWVAQQGLHCSLNIGMYEAQGISETRAWGIICADLVRHIADALATTNDVAARTMLNELRSELLQELEEPTSKVSGNFL